MEMCASCRLISLVKMVLCLKITLLTVPRYIQTDFPDLNSPLTRFLWGGNPWRICWDKTVCSTWWLFLELPWALEVWTCYRIPSVSARRIWPAENIPLASRNPISDRSIFQRTRCEFDSSFPAQPFRLETSSAFDEWIWQTLWPGAQPENINVDIIFFRNNSPW